MIPHPPLIRNFQYCDRARHSTTTLHCSRGSDSLRIQILADFRHEAHVDELAQKLNQRLGDDDRGNNRRSAANSETERQHDE